MAPGISQFPLKESKNEKKGSQAKRIKLHVTNSARQAFLQRCKLKGLSDGRGRKVGYETKRIQHFLRAALRERWMDVSGWVEEADRRDQKFFLQFL